MYCGGDCAAGGGGPGGCSSYAGVKIRTEGKRKDEYVGSISNKSNETRGRTHSCVASSRRHLILLLRWRVHSASTSPIRRIARPALIHSTVPIRIRRPVRLTPIAPIRIRLGRIRRGDVRHVRAARLPTTCEAEAGDECDESDDGSDGDGNACAKGERATFVATAKGCWISVKGDVDIHA